MATAAGIARNLGAKRQGNGWRHPCLLCGYPMSLRDCEGGRLLINCFVGGCDFSDIMADLRERDLLDDDDADDDPTPCENVQPVRDDAQRIKCARPIYAQAGHGPLVARYLGEGRLITLPPPAILREHPCCPHRLRIRLPAMVAPVVDRAGAIVGVHMTYLTPDGRAKAGFKNPENQRETRGLIRGGVIRLHPHDPDRELLISEGIETALSAAQIFKLPAWAAIYAKNLRNTLELPEAVRAIVVACDNDLAGVQAARGARDRWTAQGRSVRVVMPSEPGLDFNDVLRRRAR
jgi:hypothetical protein